MLTLEYDNREILIKVPSASGLRVAYLFALPLQQVQIRRLEALRGSITKETGDAGLGNGEMASRLFFRDMVFIRFEGHVGKIEAPRDGFMQIKGNC
jgi:hypothetical protein